MLNRSKLLSSSVLLIVTSVGFLLRLYKLGFHDFWHDEIFSLKYSFLSERLYNLPVYYFILSKWIGLSGLSEFTLRFPSMIFSSISIPLVFVLGRKIFNSKVALFSATIFALSPYQLWYAQEARSYSLMAFLGLVSANFLADFIIRKKVVFFWFFIASSIVGLYSNYFYIPFFLSQFICLVLLRKRFSLQRVFLVLLILPVILFPFMSTFFRKFKLTAEVFWVQPVKLNCIVTSMQNIFLGYNASEFEYSLLVIILGALLVFIARKVKEDEQYFVRHIFILIHSFLGIVIIFLFSIFFFPIYIDRGLIILAPYIYIFFSSVLFSIRKRIPMITIATILLSILAFSIVPYYKDFNSNRLPYHGTYIKRPIKPLANFIKNNFKENEILLFTNPSGVFPLYFYVPDLLGVRKYFIFSPSVYAKSDKWFKAGTWESGSISTAEFLNLNLNKFWVIYSDWPRSGDLDENSFAVKDFLDSRFKLLYSNSFHGVLICKYEEKH